MGQKHYVEAERTFRECLAAAAKVGPEDYSWEGFFIESMVGDSLAKQGKHGEADPVLIAGYRGMKTHEERILPHERQWLVLVVESIFNHYATWGKPEEAAKWEKELAIERAKLPKVEVNSPPIKEALTNDRAANR